jgi:methylglutaconyl-CoA hydratase
MAMLRRNVPEKRAFEMVTLGNQISAAEAAAIGLINQAIPADEFDATAAGMMSRLASQSASALILCKRLLYHQDGMSFETALRAGGDVNVLARYTDDMRIGLARFLEKRP